MVSRKGNNKNNLNLKSIALYILLDIICAGAGMGVPFFCIVLGFPLGWFLTKKLTLSEENSLKAHNRILKWSLLASAFTFLLMIIIWGIMGGMISALFNPTYDFQNFGHPFILFEPKASFIGWLILMIFVSPFLQLLTTVFTSFVILANKENQ